MDKPIINIISSQSESDMVMINATQSEIEKLLGKYGYNQNHIPNQIDHNNMNLTFEEMVAIEENEYRIKNKRIQKPNTITFDPDTVKYHQSSFGSDDELGFGFSITVTSDMNIGK